MPEERIERWYWVIDEGTRRPLLRGGRFSDTEHTPFFLHDVESPDVTADLVKAFEEGRKPRLEYKALRSRQNREKIIITDVKPVRE